MRMLRLIVVAATVLSAASVAAAVLFLAMPRKEQHRRHDRDLAIEEIKLEGIRVIDIPFREHGYRNLEPQVIRTQEEWKEFADEIIWQQRSWNKWSEFIDAVQDAKIDFGKEALVLLRHTEGSGSIDVQFRPPRMSGKTMTCNVVTKTPELCTGDVAEYCVAYAVATEHVECVEMFVDGQRSYSLAFKVE